MGGCWRQGIACEKWCGMSDSGAAVQPNRRQTAHHLLQRRQQLVQRCGLVEADIHRPLLDLRLLQRLHHHLHQVAHVEKVPGLFAITEHRDRQALHGALGEDADHPGIRRGRVLARPENIEEAEHHRLQAMLATVEVQVLFTGQLVHRIRGQRRLGGVFGDRLAFAIVAIHRRTGGEQHPTQAMHAHGFAHVEGTDEIALVGPHRVIHRGLHRGHRCKVHHGTAASRNLRDQLGIGDIAFNQLQPWVADLQVAPLPSGEVVENAYCVAFVQQRIAQVGANEAGTAGDQDGGVSHGGRNGPVEAASRRARHAA